jgi:hypothetical protein
LQIAGSLRLSLVSHRGWGNHPRRGGTDPEFDAVFTGTGQAGPSRAHRLADAGQRAAIVF